MDIVKKKYLFLVIIVIIGIVTGIIFSNIININDQKLVYDKVTNYFMNIKSGFSIDYFQTFINSFKNNILFLVLIWVLGLSIIGLFLNNLLLFFKSFVLGFGIGSIINIYLYKGIILALVYVFPHFILNILFLVFLIYHANNFSLKLFNLLFLKKDVKFNLLMKRYFKIFVIGIVSFFISSLIETFFSPFFIKVFTFLIN